MTIVGKLWNVFMHVIIKREIALLCCQRYRRSRELLMFREPTRHRLRARGLKTLEHWLNYPIRAEAFQTQLL
jgi:hypothetical protein